MNQDRRFKFTDNKIAKLNPTIKENPQQVEYSDLGETGLKLVVSTTTGRKKFYHRYHLNKTKKRMLLGEFPAISTEKAREMVARNKIAIAEGKDPVREREKVIQRPTLSEFCEAYYMNFVTSTKKSYKDDLRKLKKDIFPFFGDMMLEDIKSSQVQDYLITIQKRASNPTANRHRALLSHLMNCAKGRDLISRNPVSQVKKYTERSSYGRSLEKDESSKLFKALDEHSNRISALAVKLLLLTGMRKMECLSIKLENINLKDGYILLKEEDTKAGKERKVLLNSLALEVVNELMAYKKTGNPFLFPSKSKRGHLTLVSKTFESCKKVAGIVEDFRLHDCRHTFCSKLSEKNVPITVIQELVGHSSIAMTKRYIHEEYSQLQAYSQLIADALQ